MVLGPSPLAEAVMAALTFVRISSTKCRTSSSASNCSTLFLLCGLALSKPDSARYHTHCCGAILASTGSSGSGGNERGRLMGPPADNRSMMIQEGKTVAAAMGASLGCCEGRCGKTVSIFDFRVGLLGQLSAEFGVRNAEWGGRI